MTSRSDDDRATGVDVVFLPATVEDLRRGLAMHWFAGQMAACLYAHRDKGDWSKESPGALYEMLSTEDEELFDVLYDDGQLRTLTADDRTRAIAECVDVACSALILADVLRGMK